MPKKIIIVGGVAGGATVAARLRRIDEHAEIIMLERGEHISYANCGLPYYIGGAIRDRENLFVQTPESFGKRFRLTVRVRHEAVRINRDKRELEIRDIAAGKTYIEAYDTLVLSPGAEPIKPPLPGVNEQGIFTLRNVNDTDCIKSYISDRKPKTALVVGAGFIGLEMAENLHHLGMRVTIVEMADQVMPMFDYEMAAEIHQHLKTKRVAFFLNDGVTAFVRNPNGSFTVVLKSKRELSADIVILSIGVKPDTGLASSSGIAVGDKGAITVNEYLQTSDENIYALGDAIEFMHPILGKRLPTYLAGPANKQGRIVANNIVFGNRYTYKGSIGTSIAKVFDITVASTGLPEKFIKREKIPYASAIIHGTSHAGYYPDAYPLTLKLNFAKDGGKVLGAQIIGYEGVDKRIDLIASVIKHGGTIYELEEAEHAYAPPYSSAKDPVNILGFVAENILTGVVRTIDCFQLLNHEGHDYFLLDIRTPDEAALGGIEGSHHIPLEELRERMSEVPKDREIVVFCGVGLRGYNACRILMQYGYENVFNLNGGLKTYEHLTHKQSNEDIFANDFIGKDDDIYKAGPEGVAPKKDSVRITVDACGLQCPGPILRLKTEMQKVNAGDTLIITATDPGFAPDVKAWCNLTGNKLITSSMEKGKITAEIVKGSPDASGNALQTRNNKTLIVFSDDMDRALASFVIANGAASTGKKVTMFFTFWGLNVIKKPKKPHVAKDFMGRMFGMMMASSSKKLALSKMNMGGMGPIMMRMRMKSKNIDSLESLIAQAKAAGVQMIACQMSMDVMGVAKEELMDGVKIGGVATYLEEAEQSGLNLFI